MENLATRSPGILAAALLLLGLAPTIFGQEEKADELPGRIFLCGQRDTGVLAGIVAIDPRNETWTRISEELSQDARVSPNGRRLALTRRIKKSGARETVVMPIEGEGDLVRIFEGPGGLGCWMPDGRALLIRTHEDPADTSRFKTLRVAADGSHQEKLSLPETEVVQDCSPDGRWLLTYSSRKGPTDGPMPNYGQYLYIMRPDGKDERPLFKGIIDHEDHPRGIHWIRALWARFAPDGRRVSYTRFERKDSEGKRAVDSSLWTVGIDGENRRLILKADDGGRPSMAVWSPDGKWLAATIIAQEPDGGPTSTRIEVMDAEGGHRRSIHLPDAPSLFLIDWR